MIKIKKIHSHSYIQNTNTECRQSISYAQCVSKLSTHTQTLETKPTPMNGRTGVRAWESNTQNKRYICIQYASYQYRFNERKKIRRAELTSARQMWVKWERTNIHSFNGRFSLSSGILWFALFHSVFRAVQWFLHFALWLCWFNFFCVEQTCKYLISSIFLWKFSVIFNFWLHSWLLKTVCL